MLMQSKHAILRNKTSNLDKQKHVFVFSKVTFQIVARNNLMDFNQIAQECVPWVAPRTLAAIVRPESGFNPLAIGINGGARLVRQPANVQEAVVTAKWLIANGYNIDVGAGQINVKNLIPYGLSIDNAFDPCKNLAVAGSILYWNYQSALKKYPNPQDALRAAISAYNTGSFERGFKNGYVQKVVNASTLPLPVFNSGLTKGYK
ncbi:lytic transglycosylase domain-containing protein [Undibacterium sp.]|uniref:lytic transglycosylase domain-containing protein n=1 Tax=Undibacterium sp. TaxID=1914977 RepID=UPI0037537CEE